MVNAELDRLVPSEGGLDPTLRSAMRWSLFGGGKRFRPALVFAGGRAFDARDECLMRTAAAVEMLHTYSLVHDDLPSMDNDDLRRGRETCHRKFGEATAILAGDALQAKAFQVIADDGSLGSDVKCELINQLGQAAARMVMGQQFDLESEGKRRELRDVEAIHRNKTGALIAFSVCAGALIGGADASRLELVAEYGEGIGLLFQIVDDLLDVTETTDTLGKTAGKDEGAQKATFPSVIGIEETRRTIDEMAGHAGSIGRRLDAEILTAIPHYLAGRRS